MKDPVVWSVGLAKFALAGFITLLFRLVTPLLGMPNVAPLMATQLAGARAYGPWVAGLYGFLGMILLDACTGALGPWTIATSICYAIVGVAGGYYLKDRPITVRHYVGVSVVGTLFFDLVTGVLLAPIHGTPLGVAALGQIPFTLWHLAGNSFFALFAPWFFRSVIGNCSLELRLIGLPNFRV